MKPREATRATAMTDLTSYIPVFKMKSTMRSPAALLQDLEIASYNVNIRTTRSHYRELQGRSHLLGNRKPSAAIKALF